LVRGAYWVAAFIVAGIVVSFGSATPAQQEARPETVLGILRQGGALLLPQLGLAVLAMYLAVDRFLVIRRCCILPAAIVRRLLRIAEGRPMRLDRLERLCGKCRSPLAVLVSTATRLQGRPAAEIDQALAEVRRREFGALDRKTQWLATIASVSPLFGLAGTTYGMICTFRAISIHGSGDPKLLAAGIYVSLITTLLGIVLAIPCVAMHRAFTSKIDQLHDESEALLSGIKNN
jgi:biopolymer transport protein ExbB